MLESLLRGSRWMGKTSAVPDSYKRCTPWLEFEKKYLLSTFIVLFLSGNLICLDYIKS
jgi:hypothetical protein